MMKKKKNIRKFTIRGMAGIAAGLLCLCMGLSMSGGVVMAGPAAVPDARPASETAGVEGREADPSTLDTFQQMLDFRENARYAGRLWTDKSVFAFGQNDAGSRSVEWDPVRNRLKLTEDRDGTDGAVELDTDFLHVYSALGSTQMTEEPVPFDVMFVIDISGSMGNLKNEMDSNGNTAGTKDDFRKGDLPVNKTVNALNSAIDTLMVHSPDARFGAVVYGATSAVLLPLGSYEKDDGEDIFRAEWMETYGGNQGAHFVVSATVKEKDSGRTKTCFADNAGQTNNQAHSASAGGNNGIKGTGGHTTGAGDSRQDAYHVGHITNPQAGLAQAMDQFITGNDGTTWRDENGRTCLRVPVMVHLTDGQATDLAWIQPRADGGGDDWAKKISNWNDVNWEYDLAYNSRKIGNPEEFNASQLSGTGDVAPVLFQTLLTAAYYKSAVEAHYNRGGVKDVNGEEASLQCYSIYASDYDRYDDMAEGQKKATIDGILNPEAAFQDSAGFSSRDSGSLAVSASNAEFIDTAYELYKAWLGSGVDETFRTRTTSGSHNIEIKLNAGRGQLESGAYADQGITVTEQDIADNISYVPRDNFYHGTFADVEGIFGEIFGRLTGRMFRPVSGANDLEAGDSVTYMDPIGRYMEVKDVSDLLLFGRQYPLRKAAVYSYAFNTACARLLGGGEDGGCFREGWYRGEDGRTAKYGGNNSLPDGYAGADPDEVWEEGWVYRLNREHAGAYVPALSDLHDSGLSGSAAEKARATEYTFYRVDLDEEQRNALHMNPAYGTDAEIDRDLSYDETGGGSHMDRQAGVYALSDLHIWIEDTGDSGEDQADSSGGSGGDRIDSSGDAGRDQADSLGGSVSAAGSCQALWVDIPVNLLPLRKVTIGQDEDGHRTYRTNLERDVSFSGGRQYQDPYYSSFPLRIFYTVGLEDVLMASDPPAPAEGCQQPVDLEDALPASDPAAGAAGGGSREKALPRYSGDDCAVRIGGVVSREYIEENRVSTPAAEEARGIGRGNVEFFSNRYHPENRYSGYPVTDTDYTCGDPVVTFSPGPENRYYIFQKELPLYRSAYRYAGGAWKKVEIRENGADGDTSFFPTAFGGRVLAVLHKTDAADAADIPAALARTDPSAGQPREGDIVLLETDLLADVTKPQGGGEEADPFSPDKYFFMAVDYYERQGERAGKIRYCVTRKGSEFGAAFRDSGIDSGDMLCWHDVSGKNREIYPYLSADDTGDRSRGRDYIGYTDIYRDEAKHELKTTAELAAGQSDAHGEAMAGADWVIAARAGGLRAGTLAQAVGRKTAGGSDYTGYPDYAKERFPGRDLNVGYYGGNTTRTANNYYLPTISSKSGIGQNGIIVDTFLGNNGRLWAQDAVRQPEPADLSLDLTKRLTAGEDTQGDARGDVTDGKASADKDGLPLRNIEEGEFSFLVTPDAGNPKDDPIASQDGWDPDAGTLTVKNRAPETGDKTMAKADIFVRDKTRFTEPGAYEYTVREVIPEEALPGITYDPRVYQVKVVVTEKYDGDGSSTGRLGADVTVTDQDGRPTGGNDRGIVFVNSWDPEQLYGPDPPEEPDFSDQADEPEDPDQLYGPDLPEEPDFSDQADEPEAPDQLYEPEVPGKSETTEQQYESEISDRPDTSDEPDPSEPSEPDVPDRVKTGDSGRICLYLTLLASAVCGAAVAGTVLTSRRKRNGRR